MVSPIFRKKNEKIISSLEKNFVLEGRFEMFDFKKGRINSGDPRFFHEMKIH